MFEKLRVTEEELFVQLAAICADLSRSARLLEQLLAGGRAGEDALLARIRTTDEEAHRLARAVDTRTVKAVLLQLDRRELHDLVAALEHAISGVEAAASQGHAVHASDAPEHLRALAAALTSAAEALELAMPHAGGARGPVEPLTARVQRSRAEGGEAYYAGVGQLFATDPHAVDVLRWKDMYEKVREALEATATVAATLERLTLTHR